jgi:CubicO group peptidase (beta-lactamase class C family)
VDGRDRGWRRLSRGKASNQRVVFGSEDLAGEEGGFAVGGGAKAGSGDGAREGFILLRRRADVGRQSFGRERSPSSGRGRLGSRAGSPRLPQIQHPPLTFLLRL